MHPMRSPPNTWTMHNIELLHWLFIYSLSSICIQHMNIYKSTIKSSLKSLQQYQHFVNYLTIFRKSRNLPSCPLSFLLIQHSYRHQMFPYYGITKWQMFCWYCAVAQCDRGMQVTSTGPGQAMSVHNISLLPPFGHKSQLPLGSVPPNLPYHQLNNEAQLSDVLLYAESQFRDCNITCRILVSQFQLKFNALTKLLSVVKFTYSCQTISHSLWLY